MKTIFFYVMQYECTKLILNYVCFKPLIELSQLNHSVTIKHTFSPLKLNNYVHTTHLSEQFTLQ